MKIINGKELAERIKDGITKEIFELKTRRPGLAIILIGDRSDSKLYVNLKEQEAKKVGIDTHLYRCLGNIPEEEIFDMIRFLNEDESIDGILVQLPLPEGYDTDGIIYAINPEKDVDGFHPKNLENIFSGGKEEVMSPVYMSVIAMLESIDFDYDGKTACVIANSDIFGKTLSRIIELKGSVCATADPSDKNLSEETDKADLLITAVGRPHFIKAEMIKQDAVLIDVGITKDGDKVRGDVDPESVDGKASYISPVPGGIGPMTIAMAFKNTLELYKRRINR